MHPDESPVHPEEPVGPGRWPRWGGRGARRRAVALALGVVVAAALALAGAVPAGALEGPEALELARRHAPVVLVRAQATACGEGEPYRPTAVDAVFGRDDVVLRGPGGEAVAAPTAADLYGKGPGWHLDLPGRALEPGCTYEAWSRGVPGARDPLVYAHVTTDPTEPGWVVVQYWLYWVFNDWNDRHESDWEMVQLHFRADSVAEALGQEPVEAVYAQHEGAERVPWGSARVGKVDGTRPVVHSSQGSHASYFTARRWLGRGASTGFGCDDSRTPAERLDPEVVLLPDEVAGPDDPFAWLEFTGRWGERHAGFNNGPTGPLTKPQWQAPIAWADEHARDSSVALPELGSEVTDFFCAASRRGSLLLVDLLTEPLVVAGTLVAGIAAAVVVARRTRWRPGDPLPIASRRRAGQILHSSWRLITRHPRPFVGLGVALVLAGGLATLAQVLLLEIEATPVDDLADLVDRDSALAVPLAHAVGSVITVPAICLVGTALLVAVRDLERGRRPRVATTLREALSSPAGVLVALLVAVVVAASFWSVVLLPLGLWLLARWVVAAPASVVEGLGVRAGLRRSTALTRGHRAVCLAVASAALVLGAALGPLVGTVVLLGTTLSILWVNVISALVGAVAVPVAGVAVGLLYYDRAEAEAARSAQAAGGRNDSSRETSSRTP